MAESILWQHPLDRYFEQPLRLLVEHLARRGLANSARPRRMPIVHLALQLRSRQANLGGVDDHNEVAGILVRGVVRTRLAGQQARGARRDSSKRSLARIDHNPVTVAQSTLSRDAAGLFGQLQIRTP